jgi:hypothetical protein
MTAIHLQFYSFFLNERDFSPLVFQVGRSDFGISAVAGNFSIFRIVQSGSGGHVVSHAMSNGVLFHR